jgi:hypothetical protein
MDDNVNQNGKRTFNIDDFIPKKLQRKEIEQNQKDETNASLVNITSSVAPVPELPNKFAEALLKKARARSKYEHEYNNTEAVKNGTYQILYDLSLQLGPNPAENTITQLHESVQALYNTIDETELVDSEYENVCICKDIIILSLDVSNPNCSIIDSILDSDGKTRWVPIRIDEEKKQVQLQSLSRSRVYLTNEELKKWESRLQNYEAMKKQLPSALEENKKVLRQLLEENKETSEIGAVYLERQRMKRELQTDFLKNKPVRPSVLVHATMWVPLQDTFKIRGMTYILLQTKCSNIINTRTKVIKVDEQKYPTKITLINPDNVDEYRLTVYIYKNHTMTPTDFIRYTNAYKDIQIKTFTVHSIVRYHDDIYANITFISRNDLYIRIQNGEEPEKNILVE